MKHGVDLLKTVSLPLAHGYSLPATADMISRARQIGLEVDMDERCIRKQMITFSGLLIRKRSPWLKKCSSILWDIRKYVVHQIPGGMMSNLERQLSDLKLMHKLPEVLEEAGRVRQDLGYPVMVTPYSQLVGVQAVFNVVEGERYRTVPEELKLYVRGAYGKPAAPMIPMPSTGFWRAGIGNRSTHQRISRKLW